MADWGKKLYNEIDKTGFFYPYEYCTILSSLFLLLTSLMRIVQINFLYIHCKIKSRLTHLHFFNPPKADDMIIEKAVIM